VTVAPPTTPCSAAGPDTPRPHGSHPPQTLHPLKLLQGGARLQNVNLVISDEVGADRSSAEGGHGGDEGAGEGEGEGEGEGGLDRWKRRGLPCAPFCGLLRRAAASPSPFAALTPRRAACRLVLYAALQLTAALAVLIASYLLNPYFCAFRVVSGWGGAAAVCWLPSHVPARASNGSQSIAAGALTWSDGCELGGCFAAGAANGTAAGADSATLLAVLNIAERALQPLSSGLVGALNNTTTGGCNELPRDLRDQLLDPTARAASGFHAWTVARDGTGMTATPAFRSAVGLPAGALWISAEYEPSLWAISNTPVSGGDLVFQLRHTAITAIAATLLVAGASALLLRKAFLVAEHQTALTTSWVTAQQALACTFRRALPPDSSKCRLHCWAWPWLAWGMAGCMAFAMAQGLLLSVSTSVTPLHGCAHAMTGHLPTTFTAWLLLLCLPTLVAVVGAVVCTILVFATPSTALCIKGCARCWTVTAWGAAGALVVLVAAGGGAVAFAEGGVASVAVRLAGVSEWDVGARMWQYAVRPDAPLMLTLAVGRLAGALTFVLAAWGVAAEAVGVVSWLGGCSRLRCRWICRRELAVPAGPELETEVEG
jgi:hypothetical protein